MTKQLIFDPCGLQLHQLEINMESKAYGACTFKLNERGILYRAGKTTPNKPGLFVTTWKRNTDGITVPYDAADTSVDFLVISVSCDDRNGLFIFPKAALAEQGIFTGKKGGKRGTRIYPPWETQLNKQAAQTRNWQEPYFVDLSTGNMDSQKVKTLFANIFI